MSVCIAADDIPAIILGVGVPEIKFGHQPVNSVFAGIVHHPLGLAIAWSPEFGRFQIRRL
jgi:hypothetical protein